MIYTVQQSAIQRNAVQYYLKMAIMTFRVGDSSKFFAFAFAV